MGSKKPETYEEKKKRLEEERKRNNEAIIRGLGKKKRK